jgi:hypothetical protein
MAVISVALKAGGPRVLPRKESGNNKVWLAAHYNFAGIDLYFFSVNLPDGGLRVAAKPTGSRLPAADMASPQTLGVAE